MMNEQPVLKISDLHVALPKGGDRAFAVEGATIEVHRRQIACIVGESGSGKSITAYSVLNLLPGKALRITSGSIQVVGQEVTNLSGRDLKRLRGDRASMVFQEPLTALNPVMKVGDQIAEVLLIHRPQMRRSEVAARILSLMEDVRLPNPETLRESYPHQLSGGQRQRVMIAMALALEPALIIADEPTTALDVTTQAQILKLFRDLSTKHDSGILLITHDFGVVADVADFVFVMQRGKVVESGPPSRVLSNPSHPYTKSLIDAVPKLNLGPAPERDRKTVLDIRSLELTYRTQGFLRAKRTVKALKGVSFTLGEAETIGIVGESGSGKTTLAKCLMRFETPESGEIRFEGHDVAKLPVKALKSFRQSVQMIFQDPYASLNGRRTVGQSLIEGPVQHGLSKKLATERAQELLELVGLRADSFKRYPHEFSGGQRQRICIARALAMEPKLIIADEAVSALDVSVQAQVLNLLKDLRTRIGFSMIFITHDLRVASNVSDRIGVMHQGELVEIGPVRRIFKEPQHDYTRRLIAAMPGGASGFELAQSEAVSTSQQQNLG
ncbi:dipeptide ABC transporter ATP-binding protein [Bradyrhizobium sp. SYSU BS000235]|uniref:dipeptide ABC transporter ATP-binding protein n=1 Tax=Bradyrhizobium sp. SYSU BS000235 TaxID=3411332 RepID=UPI003C72780C